MKPQKKPKTDFFAEYHHRSKKYLPLSIAFALVLSLTVVSLMRDPTEMQSMMASVAEVGKKDIQYPADLILSQDGNTINLKFGANATHVDTIEGIILLDPTQEDQLSGDHLEFIGSGMYRFSLPYFSKSINKWTIIGQFKKNTSGKLSLSLTDTQFTSGTDRYNITNIVE